MKASEKQINKQNELNRRIETKVNSILFPSHLDAEEIKNPYITLRNINKIYGNDTQAVFDFNLNVKEKEFVVFVGPSGCGKSTTLRMICGLEEISSGELFINNKFANDSAPKNRDIAMVFQSYALYPHMSVRDNLAFSLKIRKDKKLLFDKEGKPIMWIDKFKVKELENRIKELQIVIKEADEDLIDLEKEKSNLAAVIFEERFNYYNERKDLANKEIKRLEIILEETKNTQVQKYAFKHMKKADINARVDEVAKILEIDNYLNRKPRALSGGQRQRVALGRAIIRDAKVFLMDEPLSNLDAKLRVQMRSELVAIHKKMNATTIYVTHDQIEAMTMADRIVIMKDGVVQQIGTPKVIYNNPLNKFVATFIGSPAMVILSANYDNGKITLANGDSFQVSNKQNEKVKEYYKNEINRLSMIIKNLEIALLENDQKRKNIYELALQKAQNLLSSAKEKSKTNKFEFDFGVRPEHVLLSEKDKGIQLVVEAVEMLGSDYIIHSKINNEKIMMKTNGNCDIKVDDVIYAQFSIDSIHGFDKETNIALF